jgi:glutathione S-transferase
MKLYISPTSPYARKVLVAIHEKGAADRVTPVVVDPWTNPPALLAVSPAGKVPALDTGHGPGLADSWAILLHLDAVLDGPALLPTDGEARARAVRLAGLGQALTDAAFFVVSENRRNPEEQIPALAARQIEAARRMLAALEVDDAAVGAPFDLGGITLAVALAYLDLRHASLGWRDAAPRLAHWYAAAAERPSMRATRFD